MNSYQRYEEMTPKMQSQVVCILSPSHFFFRLFLTKVQLAAFVDIRPWMGYFGVYKVRVKRCWGVIRTTEQRALYWKFSRVEIFPAIFGMRRVDSFMESGEAGVAVERIRTQQQQKTLWMTASQEDTSLVALFYLCSKNSILYFNYILLLKNNHCIRLFAS